MTNLKVVTGYVPIAGHPRTPQEYGALGEKIFAEFAARGVVPITAFYETLAECWLWKYVHSLKHPTTHSPGDNPEKNSLAYHCVQHQKFAWLLKAAIKDPKPDVFVWVDYGIGHVPGVTTEVIADFLLRVRENDFAIPGCLPRENALVNDFFPCWRFCGGLMVVPRNRVHRLYSAVKRDMISHIAQTHNLSWEVNSLARIEPQIPVRWYQADHNASLFTGY